MPPTEAAETTGQQAASEVPQRQQSASRRSAHHSTETAVLKVRSDILSALDTGNIEMLTLLDLSS